MNGQLVSSALRVASGALNVAFALALLPGCAARRSTPEIGVSSQLLAEGRASDASPEPSAEVAAASTDTQGSKEVASSPTEKATLPDPDDAHGEHEIAMANELLRRAPTPPDQFGLVLVLGQRAADLYWTFAIENRGSEPVQLASDLALLELTLTPKATADETAPPPPHVCNPLTKTPSPDKSELLPGEAEVFSFDPRTICPSELLVEGTTVTGTFGYLVEKQTKWERVKRVEVLLEDKPPFVATLKLAAETTEAAGPEKLPVGRAKTPPLPPHKKQLFTPAIVLDSTYPLEKLALFAESDPAGNSARSVAPAPIAISVRDIGELKTPTYQVVNVTLKNISAEPLDIVMRRELLTFEVVGPKGATTCRMEPTQVDPLSHNFGRLPAGASRAVATRLPEICPAGTFSAPGRYSVFVRYRSPSSGSEFGKQGFVGEIRSSEPAQLMVMDPLQSKAARSRRRRGPTQNPG